MRNEQRGGERKMEGEAEAGKKGARKGRTNMKDWGNEIKIKIKLQR